MNVQQLIESLQKLPLDMTVAVGANELLTVQTQRVLLNGEIGRASCRERVLRLV